MLDIGCLRLRPIKHESELVMVKCALNRIISKVCGRQKVILPSGCTTLPGILRIMLFMSLLVILACFHLAFSYIIQVVEYKTQLERFTKLVP